MLRSRCATIPIESAACHRMDSKSVYLFLRKSVVGCLVHLVIIQVSCDGAGFDSQRLSDALDEVGQEVGVLAVTGSYRCLLGYSSLINCYRTAT